MLSDPGLRAPLAVALGAIPGALCRYYFTLAANRWLGSGFPAGTMLVNLSGCVLIGLCFTLLAGRGGLAADLRLLLITGFMGAYTTFSSYALDTLTLIEVGRRWAALFYWLGSSSLGLVGVLIGSDLARRLS